MNHLVLLAIVWLAISVVAATDVIGTVRASGSDAASLAIPILGWIAMTVMCGLIIRRPHRVTLRGEILRVYRGFGFTEIPLSRIRHVEHDFPGRGPRRVILSIEPELRSERSLEIVEFVPRGGELGWGGKQIADELRERIKNACDAGAPS